MRIGRGDDELHRAKGRTPSFRAPAHMGLVDEAGTAPVVIRARDKRGAAVDIQGSWPCLGHQGAPAAT